LPRHL